MDTSDWRAQLPPDLRQRVTDKIMHSLKRHLPVSGYDGLLELEKIAQRFEDKIFMSAINQSDYFRKISLKMLTLDSPNPITNNVLPSQGNFGIAPFPGAESNALRNQNNTGINSTYKTNISAEVRPGSSTVSFGQEIDYPLTQSEHFKRKRVPLENSSERTESGIPNGPSTATVIHGQNNLFLQSNSASMDSNNLIRDQASQPTLNIIDWRAQLHPESRKRIVNKITDTLKKHVPISGSEGLHELQAIAQRFEDKMYTVAISQHDYLRMISIKMLTLETKSRSTIAGNMPSNEGGPSNNPSDQVSVDSTTKTAQPSSGVDSTTQTSQPSGAVGSTTETSQPSGGVDSTAQTAQPSGGVDSTTQTAQPSGDDWQEEPYQKLQTMKENYLPDLKEILQEIATRLQKYDSTPQQQKSDQIEKLKVYRMMSERLISFLQVPKNSITLSLKENLGAYEKQIVNFINSLRTREGISALQPGELPPTHMSSMPQSQSQVTSLQSHENQTVSQMQPSNLQGSAAKVAPPMQSSNSPFVLVDFEKPFPEFSSSSAINVGQHAAQSLSIGTNGISASPLLAEFSGLDGAYFNAFTATSGKDFRKEFGKELLKEISAKKIEKLKKEVESVTMKMKLLFLVICFWFFFVLFYKCM